MFNKPKKALGQNFLKSTRVLGDFIVACELSKDDVVLEVGAGTGAVTTELAKVAGKVIAVEFDRDLVDSLKESFRYIPNVTIVSEDILQFTPLCGAGKASNSKFSIFNKFSILNFQNFKIIGSIPYSITSPLIHAILTLEHKPKSVCFIVQYEVAKKICAKVPNGNYLSNLVATFGEAKIVRKIPHGAFYPAPKVDSAILKIVTHKNYPNIKIVEFSEFLHKGFKHPRKKIKQVFTLEELSKANIDPNLRPSNLSLLDWMRLFG